MDQTQIGLGIFCSTSDNRLSTNHTFKLRRLSKEAVMEAFERNSEDLLELLKLSSSMGLTIFRLGSNFIPFASHERFEEEWLLEIEERIRALSSKVREWGIRITMHPGQFVVLNSPRRKIVEASLRELEYHFRVLNALSLGRESVVVVHLGGAYGDKSEALRRFKAVVRENPWLMERLAIENDEKRYTAAEALELGLDLGLPVVFDHYHHSLNPSEFDVDELLSTWRGTTPEFHLSSAPAEPSSLGEHGDYVDLKDFMDLAELWGDRGPLDVVVEAKKKEKAVKKLMEELRSIGVELRRS